ncbi:hypothetical protein ACIQWR_01090 [Streptomyces sp. NPDC098789]|uniref:hypothetical protein n=1 Tax=Streptomyces sp. NPDC098789 TaxID=3366098 RepID=UPI0038228278
MHKWTVSAIHNERRKTLLISGVFADHRYDESSDVYTEGLYRFLRFVEAPTADAAELLVLEQFQADLLEDDEDGEVAA